MNGLYDSDNIEPVSKRPKLQLAALPNRPDNKVPKTVRKKTVEACQNCREKRIKCDGKSPCESCSRKGYECSLISTIPDDRAELTDVMNQILKRLGQVEDMIQRQSEDPGSNEGALHKLQNGGHHAPVKYGLKISSATGLNQQTGCFEYYGGTSSLVMAKSLATRLQHCVDQFDASSRSEDDGQVRVGAGTTETDELDLQTMLDSYDFVMPHNTAIRRYRTLQKDVADRHLDNFFATIHIYFPILDISNFRAQYSRLRDLFGSNLLFTSPQENQTQQQSLCLLYAVLALGALYADDDYSSSWASWYFSEAQELLGRLFDAVNLELVQAGMFMGAYAQHALRPNLAYNLAGIATRMAFSIGLNVDTKLAPHDWDAEEGRRTWWMIYIQEVELSLDSGRPMSINKNDIVVDFPNQYDAAGTTSNQDQQQQPSTEFIKALAGVAQITRAILKLIARFGITMGTKRSSSTQISSLHDRLQLWRQSLPALLRFEDEELCREPDDVNSWISRQRSSLFVHYNLALIVLHRVSFTETDLSAAGELTKSSRSTCIQAARVIILHVHSLFEASPSLRRWRYYCYYCLQAALVLLAKVIDEPAAEETKEIITVCELSVSVFQQIDLKAAERCAKMVSQVIVHWRRQQDTRQASSENFWSAGSYQSDIYPGTTAERSGPIQMSEGQGPSLTMDLSEIAQQQPAQLPAVASQHCPSQDSLNAPTEPTYQESMSESYDIDLPINDDRWICLADLEMHSHSSRNWLDILTAEDAPS